MNDDLQDGAGWRCQIAGYLTQNPPASVNSQLPTATILPCVFRHSRRIDGTLRFPSAKYPLTIHLRKLFAARLLMRGAYDPNDFLVDSR